MAKPKETIEEIRKKFFDRKKEEIVVQANEVLAADMVGGGIVYDIVQDPNVNNRSYLAVKIKYDLATKTAVVLEVTPFPDKTAGLTIMMGKENLKYLCEKKRS